MIGVQGGQGVQGEQDELGAFHHALHAGGAGEFDGFEGEARFGIGLVLDGMEVDALVGAEILESDTVRRSISSQRSSFLRNA